MTPAHPANSGKFCPQKIEKPPWAISPKAVFDNERYVFFRKSTGLFA